MVCTEWDGAYELLASWDHRRHRGACWYDRGGGGRILIEAEEFASHGGWVLGGLFELQSGSP